MGQLKKLQSVKSLWIVYWNKSFPLHHVTIKTPMLLVNNPIGSQTLFNFSMSSAGTDKPDAYGSQVMIWCGFIVKFCIGKLFDNVLAWSAYSMDEYDICIADEIDMISLQVSCWRGKILTQTQCWTPSTKIYWRWDTRCKGLGRHAAIIRWLHSIRSRV